MKKIYFFRRNGFPLFILSLLFSITFPGYTQQEERISRINFTREQSFFPLASDEKWTELHPKVPRVNYCGVYFKNKDT